MAVLKIYQVGSQVKQPGQIQTSGSIIPVGYGEKLGQGVASILEPIEKARKDLRQEEDKNEAADIITGINSSISEKFNKYKRSTRIEDVKSFNNDVMDIEFEASNKNVKKTVDKYLRDQRLDLGLKLSNRIISNSYDKSKLNKEDKLNQWITDMSSKDPTTRLIATRNYNTFFQNPEELNFYGETNFQKLKTEKDKLKLHTILINQIDNDEVDLTDKETRKKINEQFGGNIQVYLDRANNKLIANELKLDAEFKKQEKATVEQQLNNFTSVLQNINNAKLDNTKQPLTLDNIYDMYQIGSINTVQYNALVKLYVDPNKTSDEDVLEIISAQLAYGNNAQDFDNLKKAIHSDRNIIEGLSPQDTILFHDLIKKYGGDVDGFKEFQYYQDRIGRDLKDVQKAIVSFKDTDQAARAKQQAEDFKIMYGNYVNEGFSPQDAYLKTITNYTNQKSTLPKVEDLPMPIGIKIDGKNLKNKIQTDPDNTRKSLYQDIVAQYKNDKNLPNFKENIKKLDFIFDVYDIREKLNLNAVEKQKDEGGTK